MNREIKFRAWVKPYETVGLKQVEGCMYDRVILDCMMGTVKVGFVNNPYCGLKHFDAIYLQMGKVIIMQFTGRKDKNGQKVFEGDICKQEQYWDSPRAIEFNHLGTVCSVNESGQNPFTMSMLSGLEVIGNIYQDSQLLDIEEPELKDGEITVSDLHHFLENERAQEIWKNGL